MERDLTAKVVLLTGAAGGFGQAIASAFAARGAQLALLDLNALRLEQLVTTLEAAGTRVQATVTDLSTRKGVQEGITQVLHPFHHRVDIVIANVGLLIADAVEQLTDDMWIRAFTLNFLTHVWAVETVLPLMQQQHSGSFVFVGSDQGLQPNAGLAPYAPVKAALHNYAKILARELPPQGITARVIAPGMARTPLVTELLAQRARTWNTDLHTAEQRELHNRQIPVGRLGEPEEIAQAVVFLATQPFSNGSIFDFSGGNVRG